VWEGKTGLAKNPEFRNIWDQVHESIMSEFIIKFDTYFQSWLKSPAGTAYSDEIVNCRCIHFPFLGLTFRKKKSAIPGYDLQHLKEYTNPAGQRHPGIDWGIKQIFDIFFPLSSITDVVSVKVWSPVSL